MTQLRAEMIDAINVGQKITNFWLRICFILSSFSESSRKIIFFLRKNTIFPRWKFICSRWCILLIRSQVAVFLHEPWPWRIWRAWLGFAESFYFCATSGVQCTIFFFSSCLELRVCVPSEETDVVILRVGNFPVVKELLPISIIITMIMTLLISSVIIDSQDVSLLY